MADPKETTKENAKETVANVQAQAQALAENIVKAMLPDLKKQILAEMRENALPDYAPVQQHGSNGQPFAPALVGASYPVPAKHRLPEKANFFAPAVGRFLVPYVDESGETKYPPNGLGYLAFNGRIQMKNVGGVEMKVRHFGTDDGRMKEWLEKHPQFGIRFFNRATTANLSGAALLNEIGTSQLAYYSRLSHGELLKAAVALKVPPSDDPHTLRKNVAAAAALQQVEAKRQQAVLKTGAGNKELAMMGITG